MPSAASSSSLAASGTLARKLVAPASPMQHCFLGGETTCALPHVKGGCQGGRMLRVDSVPAAVTPGVMLSN
jgi:hypothetical protein